METQTQPQIQTQINTDETQQEKSTSNEKKPHEEIVPVIEGFIKELKTVDASWLKCNSTEAVSVWFKSDEKSGIHRVKIIGRIPVPVEVVDKVLFDNQLRIAWDSVLESAKELTEFKEHDNGLKTCFIHFVAKGAYGVAGRDFVHLRAVKNMETKGEDQPGKLVLDTSTTHIEVKEKEGYVRAHTYFSGGIIEPTLIPNLTTKKLDNGTLYSMISQVDLKGYIPKTIINMVSASTTLEWFQSLARACEAYKQGKLKPLQS